MKNYSGKIYYKKPPETIHQKSIYLTLNIIKMNEESLNIQQDNIEKLKKFPRCFF